MKVNVSQLRRTEGGSERFRFSESFPPFELGNDRVVFQSPMDVQLDVINAGKSLLVNGKADAELTVNCSRCLKEFVYDLEFNFEDEWIPSEFATPEEEAALIFEKDEFTIDERILEHIIVHLPMRFICSPDCKGLCVKCGVDLNETECICAGEDIDPRLEILTKWNKGV